MAARGARETAARVARYVEAEEEATPDVCSACLGPTATLRMQRTAAGKKCHTCAKPYASFAWRPSQDARTRFTLICKACSGAKNACQSCLHDLATGLSMDKREQLSADDTAALMDRKRARTMDDEIHSLRQNAQQVKARFAQKPCSFFAKGFCSRGVACPFAHQAVPEAAAPAEAGGDDDDDDSGVASPVEARGGALANIKQQFAHGKTVAATAVAAKASSALLIADRAPAPVPNTVDGAKVASADASAANASTATTAVAGNKTDDAPAPPAKKAAFDFSWME
jgi:hypothetical protein